MLVHPVGLLKESLEHDKQTLSTSIEKMQRTRSSVETKCMRERVVLREKLRQTDERAGNTGTIAEQLQAQNMELRHEEADAKRKLAESQHAIAESTVDLEHLKDSVRQELKRDWPHWAPATNQSIPEMVAFVVSSLRVENTELHAMVSNLKANTSTTHHQLQAKGVAAASAQDDGSDEMAQTLQEQNMDLQRQGAATQLEVKNLRSQISGLQDDKAHLLGTLQTAMSETMLLRQEIAQMRKDKDEEIRKMKDEMAQHTKALSAKPSIAVTAALPAAQPIAQSVAQPLAQPPVQPLAQLSADQVVEDLVSLPVQHPATVGDPILEMRNKAAEKHDEVEEMKKLATESFEPLGLPLSAWDVLPEVPHEIMKLTKSSRPVSWLGATSSAKVSSWSPVDALDPEATVTAQRAQTFDETGDAEVGDSVAQLLKRAQSVVSDGGAAA